MKKKRKKERKELEVFVRININNFVLGCYSSVVSSAQQVQRFTFPSRSPSLVVEDNSTTRLHDEVQDIYAENDSDVIGPDGSRRSSDLYSPELNLEAHRTAQEVVCVESRKTLEYY